MNDLIGGQLLSVSTPQQLEEYAKLWVSQHVKSYEMPSYATFMGDPSRKWRISSAWQKAIRRGDVETAHRMLNALWDHDPKYVLYRFPVILLEDVGWGNAEILLIGMLIANHQKWMMDNGGAKKIIFMLTELAAKGGKDRSMCDLAVAADQGFVSIPEIKELFLHKNAEERKKTVYNSSASLTIRMAALWSLAGSGGYAGSNMMTPYFVHSDAIAELMEEFDPIGRLVWATGRKRMKSGMPLAAPLIYSHLKDCSWSFKETELADGPQDVMLGNYHGYVFDWHTSEGKSSMAYFLKACEPWAKWLSAWLPEGQKSERISMTAWFLFMVEGELLNKRLWYSSAGEHLRYAGLQYKAIGIGMDNLADVHAGLDLLAHNIPMLNYARARIVGVDIGPKPDVWCLP